MIFYILIFLLSFGGALYIILRHKHELSEQYKIFLAEHPANFAHFMSDILIKLRGLWDDHMRNQILLFVEKRLRWFRILVLRIEHLLFKATHRVRDASGRNASSTNETKNAIIDQDKEIK